MADKNNIEIMNAFLQQLFEKGHEKNVSLKQFINSTGEMLKPLIKKV